MDTPDLHKILESIGIQGVIPRGNNLMGCCPFHIESNPSWGISVNAPHFHGCFSCGSKGALVDLLVRIGKYPLEKANRVCQVTDSIVAFPDLNVGHVAEETTLADESFLYPYSFTPFIRRYLKARGVNPLAACKAGLVHNFHDNSLIYPWRVFGDYVGATGRTLSRGQQAKTLAYGGIKKGNYFYMPSGKIRRAPFVIVEGELDALKVYCAGFKNVGAICFGRFTKRQASLTLNHATSVVVFTDDDATGQLIRGMILKMLAGKMPVSVADYSPFRDQYEDKLDPGGMTLPDIREILTKVNKHADWPSF